eukprot:EG_transcript_31404
MPVSSPPPCALQAPWAALSEWPGGFYTTLHCPVTYRSSPHHPPSAVLSLGSGTTTLTQRYFGSSPPCRVACLGPKGAHLNRPAVASRPNRSSPSGPAVLLALWTPR